MKNQNVLSMIKIIQNSIANENKYYFSCKNNHGEEYDVFLITQKSQECFKIKKKKSQNQTTFRIDDVKNMCLYFGFNEMMIIGKIQHIIDISYILLLQELEKFNNNLDTNYAVQLKKESNSFYLELKNIMNKQTNSHLTLVK